MPYNPKTRAKISIYMNFKDQERYLNIALKEGFPNIQRLVADLLRQKDIEIVAKERIENEKKEEIIKRSNESRAFIGLPPL